GPHVRGTDRRGETRRRAAANAQGRRVAREAVCRGGPDRGGGPVAQAAPPGRLSGRLSHSPRNHRRRARGPSERWTSRVATSWMVATATSGESVSMIRSSVHLLRGRRGGAAGPRWDSGATAFERGTSAN